MLTRRRFLFSTAIGSAAATTVGAVGVSAFDKGAAPKAVNDSYAAAGASCAPVVHDRLRFQLEASLKGKTVTEAEVAAMSQANSCPFCGCNLAANQPLPGIQTKATN